MGILKATQTAALALCLAGALAACDTRTERSLIGGDQVAPTAGLASAETTGADDDSLALVDGLLQAGDVQAALAHIEATIDADIATMVALNEIPAPPFAEEVRADAFAQLLREAGLGDVSIDAVGNVVGVRPGCFAGRNIAVVAHIDTVFPPQTDVTVRQDGDTFYAPGIGDNTRGLVATLSLVDALTAADISTRDTLLFIGSVGEEGLGDLRGVRHLFRPGAPKIDSFIAIDGGGQDRLVVSAVGSNRYRVTFTGPGGHSYGAFGRGHPHQALAGAIMEFTRLATPITEQSGPKATFSVGRIGGGTSINSIPFESWMEVDMRSVDPRKLDALDAAFRDAIALALDNENARRTRDTELEVEIRPVGARPAGRGDPSLPLIRHALASMERSGLSPNMTASSTDANIPIWLGVPAITLSRGGISRNAHALDESWTNQDTALAERIALLTMLAEAGHVEGSCPAR